ncbi:flagellar motor protein MotB [Patulibacter sp. NPDC049589]|uniref:flagellar motor protein MotB n=1 Tax=Patulibacter sp. NPDC049589 TaxID=3154731 RepID=UPI003423DD8F
MSGSGRRSRRGGGGHGAANHERWLLTWADLLTLLLALFIVMYAASVVDQRKAADITKSLQEAFAGKVLKGGGSIRDESTADKAQAPVAAVSAIAPLTPKVAEAQQLAPSRRAAAAARVEEQELTALKRRLDDVIAAKGLEQNVQTAVERKGLVIRVLTDDVLFASGSAALSPDGGLLLDQLKGVLQVDRRHPIAVDGHTDSMPISTGRFPDNWELSAARATSVVRRLAGSALDPSRFSATGHAAEQPRASNATDAGRRANRRVEIALTRLHPTP